MSPDLDNTSEKEILANISHQLYVQNQLLEQLVEPQEESNADRYSCDFCNETVAKEDRESHLRQNHNYVDGASVSKRFTPV